MDSAQLTSEDASDIQAIPGSREGLGSSVPYQIAILAAAVLLICSAAFL